jgi:hypothetical protein
LLEHIRHTLQYAFHSPVRRAQARERYLLRSPDAKPLPPPRYEAKVVSQEDKGGKHKKGRGNKNDISRRKRRSFDNVVWNKINSLRSSDQAAHQAAGELRQGHKPTVVKKKEKDAGLGRVRVRRHSFGEEKPMDQLTAVQKGNLYGNMALEYDMIQKEMMLIKAEHLLVFQSMLNCQAGRLFFVSEHANEIIVLIGHQWYREAIDSDIAGVCAQSGRVMNIPDVYADHRFNRNLDTMTGFKTRNMLCMPIRANRGGGKVIGVVQMVNKADNLDFNESDEQVLSDCVQRIADDIHLRFQELKHAAEALTGSSTFVAEGSKARHGVTYSAATVASTSHKTTPWHGPSSPGLHSVHGAVMDYSDDSKLEHSQKQNKEKKRQEYGNMVEANITINAK